MASILYAWEFGAGLGHVGPFLPLARALRDLGHEVHWVVTQPAAVGDLLASNGFTWLAAPTILEQLRPGPPLSYADILLRFGYGDPKDLFGLVGAWRELMRLTGATLVLADHAPTALVAARTLGIPLMQYSTGFTIPPHSDPLPNMRPWVTVAEQSLRELDRMALNSINAVLTRCKTPELPVLAALFDVAEQTLVTFPELDHYADRGPARYWGSLPSSGGGRPADWPEGGAARCFAYLRPDSPHLDAALGALRELDVATLVYAPGLSVEAMARHRSSRLHFLDHPADMTQMVQEADVAVTYASLATTTAFLLGGKPLLMLPWHLEQFLVARRVVEMGAGIVINPELPPGDLRESLRQLIATPTYGDNARAFAKRYAAFDQSQIIRNLVRRIDELINIDKTPEQTPESTGELT